MVHHGGVHAGADCSISYVLLGDTRFWGKPHNRYIRPFRGSAGSVCGPDGLITTQFHRVRHTPWCGLDFFSRCFHGSFHFYFHVPPQGDIPCKNDSLLK